MREACFNSAVRRARLIRALGAWLKDKLNGREVMSSNNDVEQLLNNLPCRYFAILDLHGPKDVYTPLYQYLKRLGAQKVMSNGVQFTDNERQGIEAHARNLLSVAQSCHRVRGEDKVMVFETPSVVIMGPSKAD